MDISPTARDLIDAELLEYAESLPKYDLTPERLRELREEEDRARPPNDDDCCGLVSSDDDHKIRVRIHRPLQGSEPSPAVLHIHGGGFIAGSSADSATLHQKRAHALGCVIVSVDYRLSPETHFPASIDDCYAALDWMFRNHEELQIDTGRIGVMGESAGGGLAAALALLARDRGELPLAFQHLTYPMLDDRSSARPDPHPFTGHWAWTRDNNFFAWRALLGCEPGSFDVSPYAAPARAQDLSGLPPTFLLVGALDLFLEETMDYGRRLMRAGVAVELHVYPGAFHGFDLHPTARIAKAARRDSLAALARFVRAPEPGSGA